MWHVILGDRNIVINSIYCGEGGGAYILDEDAKEKLFMTFVKNVRHILLGELQQDFVISSMVKIKQGNNLSVCWVDKDVDKIIYISKK